MGVVDVDCEVSVPGARVRTVRVMGSVRCMGWIRLCLHLGLRSDVRETV